MDFDALVLGALDPPIQPCSRLSRPAHRANFDGRFTTLPVDTPVEGPDPAFLDGDDALATGWEFVRPEPCKFIVDRRGGVLGNASVLQVASFASIFWPALRSSCVGPLCSTRVHVTAHPYL